MTDKTMAQLQYIARDCMDAVVAYPEGHKAIEYLETAKAAREEIVRREREAAHNEDGWWTKRSWI